MFQSVVSFSVNSLEAVEAKTNLFTINGIKFPKKALLLMSPVLCKILEDDVSCDHLDGVEHVTKETLKLCADAMQYFFRPINKLSIVEFMTMQPCSDLLNLAAFTHRYDISSIHNECDNALAKQDYKVCYNYNGLIWYEYGF